jgi:hypothetical protein
LNDCQALLVVVGRGPWKKRLPQIVETLVSLGRARRVAGGVIGVI